MTPVTRASIRAPWLYLTAFVCGFCLMALELMAGRILQPAFGASIDVWAAVISTFILALSIGAIIGGQLADRSATPSTLGWIIVASALFYLLLPTYAHPVIDLFGPVIQAARWGALLAALALFLPPACLLGCVYPILVQRAVASPGRVGRIAGTLLAVGCVGNVLGVLVSDYVLLLQFTVNANVWGMGLVLGMTGVAHLGAPRQSGRKIR